MARPRILFLSPIRPGLVGSGLALRAAMWVRALSALADTATIVVPVSDGGAVAGPLPDPCTGVTTRPPGRVVSLPTPEQCMRGAVTALADGGSREMMAAFDVEIPQVTAAPPWLGASIDMEPVDVIVCLRSYLVPFAAGLRAASAPAAALVVDLDDDDAAFARSFGDDRLAQSFDRLAQWTAGHATAVVAAGSHELRDVGVLPNCIDVPATVAPRPSDVAAPRLLFVGNLTYAPNIEAVEWYLRHVHPIVRARHPSMSLRLVGRGGARWLSTPGVDVAGLVDDLAPEYAAAHVVVVPLRRGSGTRIKVIEAWAQGVPVVATPAAVEGLECMNGTQVLLADDPSLFAASIEQLLDDRGLCDRLVGVAHRHVTDHYSLGVFDRKVSALLDPLLRPQRGLPPHP